MNLQSNGISFFILLYTILITVDITTSSSSSPSSAIKNSKINNKKNNLTTSKTEYILKHILFVKPIELISKSVENESNKVIEQEVKTTDNINNELIKNDSTILEQQQQHQQQQQQKEYNINNPTDILDENEDTEGFLSRQKTFIDFYYEGVTAYLSNDWLGCISLIERAVVLYQDYYNALSYCRVSCDIERKSLKPQYEENYEYYHFYEGILHKTLCLEKCRRLQMSSVSKFFTIEFDDKIIFKSRIPYTYLQICYYRDNELDKAINAAFTAFIGNNRDKVMQKNLKYYASLNKFDYENLKDLEDKEYSNYYTLGRNYYNDKNWNGTIENMEKFLSIWMQEYDKCRAFCEDDYYQGWLPDFTTAIANHYVSVLRCKQNCTAELAHVHGKKFDDLFISAYDYLQYTYYQVGDILKGAQCVGSYLLVKPDSKDMIDSYTYYKNIPNVTEKYFQPREEAKKFYGIQKYESYLLEFVDREFSKLMMTEDQTFRQSSLEGYLFKPKKVEDEVEAENDLNYTYSTFLNAVNDFIIRWKWIIFKSKYKNEIKV